MVTRSRSSLRRADLDLKLFGQGSGWVLSWEEGWGWLLDTGFCQIRVPGSKRKAALLTSLNDSLIISVYLQ